MKRRRQAENLQLNQTAINQVASCIGYGYSRANVRFLNLNPDEQRECIKRLGYKGSLLCLALSRRYSLEVINVFALFDQEALKDPKKIFDSYWIWTEFYCPIPQKEVLSY